MSDLDLAEEVDAATWLDRCFRESEQLAAATDASARQRIALGERTGQKVRRIGRKRAPEPTRKRAAACTRVGGESQSRA